MAVDTTLAARKKFTMSQAQANLWTTNVARRISETDTEKMGTIYNPYTSYPAISKGVVTSPSYNIADYNADADTLEVNLRADVSEHVNSYDWKSVGFDLLRNRGMEFGNSISKVIDGDTLTEPVDNANTTKLGDNGVPGSTTPWTSSNTVIDDIINAGIETIDVNDAQGRRKYAVVSPFEANDLRSFMQNNGFNVADENIRDGLEPISAVDPYVGRTFSGVDVYQTNNLRNTAVLSLATNPTDGNIITINGVTLTFVDALTPTAGEVHIGTTVDDTRANLATFLTGTTYPGDTDIAETATTGAVALSTEDQYSLARIGSSFANDNTADTLTVTANSTLVVSQNLTDGTDAWGAVSRYMLVGNYGATFLALPQLGMDYHEKEVTGKAGVEIFMEQFYNKIVWKRQEPQVVPILVN